MNTRRIATLGMLLAVTLILGLVENMLPPVFAALPYARLGLGNVALLLVMIWFGGREALLILVLKCVLLGIFCGNPSIIPYSLLGGLAALLAMRGLLLLGRNGLPAISAAGGAMHNLGQVLMAVLITETPAVFIYLPYLMLFGMLAGCLTGVIIHYIIKKIPMPF